MSMFLGLNKWAEKFVQGEKECPYVVIKVESGQEVWRWSMTFHPLYSYIFPDGRVFSEEVQYKEWGDIFLALKDEKGNWVPESLWHEPERCI